MLTGREREFLEYFYRNDEFHVVPGSFTEESIDIYVKALSRPGRMQPSYELYRTIEQDVRDNTAFAATPLAVPVLAIGARGGAGEFAIKAAGQVASHVTPVLMENTEHFMPEERPVLETLANKLARRGREQDEFLVACDERDRRFHPQGFLLRVLRFHSITLQYQKYKSR